MWPLIAGFILVGHQVGPTAWIGIRNEDPVPQRVCIKSVTYVTSRGTQGGELSRCACETGVELRRGEELVSPVPLRLRHLSTVELQDGHIVTSPTAISVIRGEGPTIVSPASVRWAWIGDEEISITNRSKWALSLSTMESQSEEPSSCGLKLLLAGQQIRMRIARHETWLLIRSAATPSRGGTRIRLVRVGQIR